VVLPKVNALGVLLGTIASLGMGRPLFSVSSLTVFSSHGDSPGLIYFIFVVRATMLGPTAYWNRINRADPPRAMKSPVSMSS